MDDFVMLSDCCLDVFSSSDLSTGVDVRGKKYDGI